MSDRRRGHTPCMGPSSTTHLYLPTCCGSGLPYTSTACWTCIPLIWPGGWLWISVAAYPPPNRTILTHLTVFSALTLALRRAAMRAVRQPALLPGRHGVANTSTSTCAGHARLGMPAQDWPCMSCMQKAWLSTKALHVSSHKWHCRLAGDSNPLQIQCRQLACEYTSQVHVQHVAPPTTCSCLVRRTANITGSGCLLACPAHWLLPQSACCSLQQAPLMQQFMPAIPTVGYVPVDPGLRGSP